MNQGNHQAWKNSPAVQETGICESFLTSYGYVNSVLDNQNILLKIKLQKKKQIVEATGWIVDKDGNIEFVPQANQINPHRKQTSASCAVSR